MCVLANKILDANLPHFELRQIDKPADKTPAAESRPSSPADQVDRVKALEPAELRSLVGTSSVSLLTRSSSRPNRSTGPTSPHCVGSAGPVGIMVLPQRSRGIDIDQVARRSRGAGGLLSAS